MLKCALSGQEPPEHPVISRLSGHVFERRLIEKHLETSDKCPFTGEPLTKNDLIDVQVNHLVRPRPAKATSIPSMINLFQNEWDAVMLESFALKEQLHTVRQELAHALYQQDAACRVIARLVKERDEARRQLATAQAQLATTLTIKEDAMDTESKGISEQVKQKMINLSKKLTAERKKRIIAPETATVEDIRQYAVLSSHPVHAASKPGILCLDIHPNQNLLLTGGVDRNVVLFSREEQRIISTLQGHTKKVSDVVFHPQQDLLLSASHDKTVRLWTPSGANKYDSQALRLHEGEVVGIALHPTGDYFVSASTDSSWAFTDIQDGRCLAQIKTDEPEPIQCVKFHPDGLILGTGTVADRIRVWDVKTMANVASFEGHKGKVTGISFSENGFYMASAGEDGTVKLWDLRKLKTIQTINLEGSCGCLAFDFSGKYLAVGGDDIRVFAVATDTLEQIVSLNDHTAPVTAVKWGQHCSFLASTSLDRTMKFYGSAKGE